MSVYAVQRASGLPVSVADKIGSHRAFSELVNHLAAHLGLGVRGVDQLHDNDAHVPTRASRKYSGLQDGLLGVKREPDYSCADTVDRHTVDEEHRRISGVDNAAADGLGRECARHPHLLVSVSLHRTHYEGQQVSQGRHSSAAPQHKLLKAHPAVAASGGYLSAGAT